MTPNQKLAAEAIKAAAGLDAAPVSQSTTIRAHRPGMLLDVSHEGAVFDARLYFCGRCIEVRNGSAAEAVNKALDIARAEAVRAVEALQVPGWPRLEWDCEYSLSRLNLHVGSIVTPVLDVMTFESRWSVAAPNIPTPKIFTRAKVLAWVKAHVESLGLPCALPPFPGASDAS